MNYNTLERYYKTLFAMSYHHKFSINELEDLIPFELEIFTEMVAADIKKREERQGM